MAEQTKKRLPLKENETESTWDNISNTKINWEVISGKCSAKTPQQKALSTKDGDDGKIKHFYSGAGT